MKAAEIRAMTDEQLKLTLNEVYKNLFHLRFQSATDRLETPSEIQKAKRDVARILTVRHERDLAEKRKAAEALAAAAAQAAEAAKAEAAAKHAAAKEAAAKQAAAKKAAASSKTTPAQKAATAGKKG